MRAGGWITQTPSLKCFSTPYSVDRIRRGGGIIFTLMKISQVKTSIAIKFLILLKLYLSKSSFLFRRFHPCQDVRVASKTQLQFLFIFYVLFLMSGTRSGSKATIQLVWTNYLCSLCSESTKDLLVKVNL